MKYQIMHKNRIVAEITGTGVVHIFDAQFIPYALYLEEGTEGDFDGCFNNLVNFYAWLAGRTLTLERKYAKEILNSIGATQAVTDKEKAFFAIKYRAVTLTDVYWVREDGDTSLFEDINLYDNHLDNSFVDVSLRGKQITVTGTEFDADVSTAGVFPKAWVRRGSEFYLLKDGGASYVKNEYLASKVASCFEICTVSYNLSEYAGRKVTESKLISSKDYSLVTMEDFNIYAINKDLDPLSEIIRLDSKGYYMMNIIDYLIGNTDRHWGNWGVLIDNNNNKPVRLYDLMDFNQAFNGYDSMSGGLCLTSFGRTITQQQAAVEAVKAIGFEMKMAPKEEWFTSGALGKYRMLTKRIDYLKRM